jgi:hypothetical protein
MSITRLECQVSELVNSDTPPRPTTQELRIWWQSLSLVQKTVPGNKEHLVLTGAPRAGGSGVFLTP